MSTTVELVLSRDVPLSSSVCFEFEFKWRMARISRFECEPELAWSVAFVSWRVNTLTLKECRGDQNGVRRYERVLHAPINNMEPCVSKKCQRND